MSKKVENMGWKQEAAADEVEEVVSEEIPKELQPVNEGLDVKEMKRLFKHYKSQYPKLEVLPLIVKGMTANKSRFYVLRALAQSEVPKLQELFARLQEKEVEVFRARMRDDYLEKLGGELKEIPENKIGEFNMLCNVAWEGELETILKNINQVGMNMMAVPFPENHKDRMQADLVPPGDIDIITMATQTLSGWSAVRTDIGVYEKETTEDPAIAAFYKQITGQADDEPGSED
jgi:hypothetical protein